MAQVRIIEVFEADFQAQAEVIFKDDDNNEIKIPASEARKAQVAVCETNDGARVPLELPTAFTGRVGVGDVLDIQCSSLRHLDRYWRVKHVRRVIKANTKN